MTKAVQLYKLLFTIIFTLYLYLGKGIAYGYFAEILLVFGLILLIKQRKEIEIINNKSSKLLYLFLFLNLIFILRGFFNFPIIDTIRDAFIFNYIYFSFKYLLVDQTYLGIFQPKPSPPPPHCSCSPNLPCMEE